MNYCRRLLCHARWIDECPSQLNSFRWNAFGWAKFCFITRKRCDILDSTMFTTTNNDLNFTFSVKQLIADTHLLCYYQKHFSQLFFLYILSLSVFVRFCSEIQREKICKDSHTFIMSFGEALTADIPSKKKERPKANRINKWWRANIF